ncbi:uncharacterized protein LOC135696773 [Rhopilema esculentum]|uniref:uncharacterized protein LOC135696773 n=1 Tax=Rhopilema esculentum TaxID=499914 RepID=UPI0031D99D74|eukprot:gene12803-3542_t
MIFARNLILLAINLCYSKGYTETKLPGNSIHAPSREDSAMKTQGFIIECNMLEQFHKEKQISEREYEKRLKACKETILTDTRTTETATDDDKGGLKIYFTEEEEDRNEKYKLLNDHPIGPNEQEHGGHLKNLLLTSIDDKQINSRHELYKNPKTPQIKFRTEPSSSLRSVASPLLVQNSVRNRLHEKEAKQRKRKRGIKSNYSRHETGPYRVKRSMVNGATWFKKYQAIYNNMLQKRSKYQPIPYALQQQAPQPTYYAQQPVNTADRANIPAIQYAYNYVYPLYHLHSDDAGYKTRHNIPSYDLRASSTRMPIQLHNSIPAVSYSSTTAAETKNFQNIMPAVAQTGQTSTNGQSVFIKKNDIQNINLLYKNVNGKRVAIPQDKIQSKLNEVKKVIYPDKKMRDFSTSIQEHALAQEHELHRIGLKDDASFMEAKPNYDRSPLTLHAVQSLLPRPQARNLIPSMQKDATQKAPGIHNSRLAFLKVPPTFEISSNNARDSLFSRGQQQRSEIARPGPQNNRISSKDIALSFYTELQRPQISFPKDASDEKKDVIYSTVNPSSDIDSDDITAENLAAIFNELDGEIDHVLKADTAKESVSKKDVISEAKSDVERPQDQIEMTVYDASTDKPKTKGVHFIKSLENEINFEQKLGIFPAETDDTKRSMTNSELNQKFNLSQLHYGLRNGNTFE